jgi:hypothetical protein
MMANIDKILQEMRNNPQGIKFSDLKKVCEHYFGNPRIGGSHHCFDMPWPGDPRINIQSKGANAKPYQVRQVIAAIDKLERR